MGGVESNYLVQCVPCIEDFSHPDFPAIMVFMEYLGALEVVLNLWLLYKYINYLGTYVASN